MPTRKQSISGRCRYHLVGIVGPKYGPLCFRRIPETLQGYVRGYPGLDTWIYGPQDLWPIPRVSSSELRLGFLDPFLAAFRVRATSPYSIATSDSFRVLILGLGVTKIPLVPGTAIMRSTHIATGQDEEPVARNKLEGPKVVPAQHPPNRGQELMRCTGGYPGLAEDSFGKMYHSVWRTK